MNIQIAAQLFMGLIIIAYSCFQLRRSRRNGDKDAVNASLYRMQIAIGSIIIGMTLAYSCMLFNETSFYVVYCSALLIAIGITIRSICKAKNMKGRK